MDVEDVYESSKELLNNSGKESCDAEPAVETEEIGSTSVKSVNEVLTKFRAIIAEYLNGETVLDGLDNVTKDVLGSYSLAGYLDYAIPSGKEIVVTKLLQHCCFQIQDLLR